MYVVPIHDGVTVLFAVGFLINWLGRDDDSGVDLETISARLDTRPTEDAVLDRLDDLATAVDSVVSHADLEQHAMSPPAPDASSVEKVEALSRALDRNEISIGSQTQGRTTESGSLVSDVAYDLQAARAFDSGTAARLADVLADPEATGAQSLRRTLTDSVDELNSYARLDDALVSGVPESDHEARQIATELDDRDPVESSAAAIARAAAPADDQEETELRALVATILRVYEDETGTQLDGSNVRDRARALVAAVESDGFGGDDDVLETVGVAGRIDETLQPEGEPAQRLLRALAENDTEQLESALRRAVQDLEFAATTRGVVGSVNRDAVLHAIRDLREDATDHPGPTADVLSTRLDGLESAVQRAHESNLVVPYWVKREVAFYESTLLPALERAMAGDTDSIPSRRDDVESHRRQIVEQHVETKSDHNHSIPLHFLKVVDGLLETAAECETHGDTDAARGWLGAADAVLDAIEQLYEQNEYSVMLRRLRG